MYPFRNDNVLGVAGEQLVRAVAVNAYKLMAYKDEYDIAHLYAASQFRADLEAQFSGAWGRARRHEDREGHGQEAFHGNAPDWENVEAAWRSQSGR